MGKTKQEGGGGGEAGTRIGRGCGVWCGHAARAQVVLTSSRSTNAGKEAGGRKLHSRQGRRERYDSKMRKERSRHARE